MRPDNFQICSRMQLYIPKKVPKCPEFSDCIYPYIILLAAFMAGKKESKEKDLGKKSEGSTFLDSTQKEIIKIRERRETYLILQNSLYKGKNRAKG